MNNILEKQEHIQLFSVSSLLGYAALYENFETPIDQNASAHLWLYSALDRTTPKLQKTLNKIAKLFPSQLIQLKKDVHGKPYFEPPYENIAVSLSYTNQFGLLGLSTKTNIGVDIVEVAESFNISEVVNSHFHFSEQLLFNNLDYTSAKNYFFNAWALKEAILKSTGEGITFGGLSKIIVGLKDKSYVIKDGFEKEKAITGSITLKRNDTELVIGVSVY